MTNAEDDGTDQEDGVDDIFGNGDVVVGSQRSAHCDWWLVMGEEWKSVGIVAEGSSKCKGSLVFVGVAVLVVVARVMLMMRGMCQIVEGHEGLLIRTKHQRMQPCELALASA